MGLLEVLVGTQRCLTEMGFEAIPCPTDNMLDHVWEIFLGAHINPELRLYY